MTKQDDKINDSVNKAIDARINRGMRWICITATSATIMAINALGKFLVGYWNELGIGVQAFLEAIKK